MHDVSKEVRVKPRLYARDLGERIPKEEPGRAVIDVLVLLPRDEHEGRPECR